jgi:hypothetical protein
MESAIDTSWRQSDRSGYLISNGLYPAFSLKDFDCNPALWTTIASPSCRTLGPYILYFIDGVISFYPPCLFYTNLSVVPSISVYLRRPPKRRPDYSFAMQSVMSEVYQIPTTPTPTAKVETNPRFPGPDITGGSRCTHSKISQYNSLIRCSNCSLPRYLPSPA